MQKDTDMLTGITTKTNTHNFKRIIGNSTQLKQYFKKLENMGIDQQIAIANFVSRAELKSSQDFKIIKKAQKLMRRGSIEQYWRGIRILNRLVPEQASAIRTEKGLVIMAEGWDKPILFPKEKGFKWIGWTEDPYKLKNDELWTAAYGEKPGVILGAVGNSNIKSKQVKNGCTLSDKELSALYESAIENFYNPIINYFKSIGIKADDIGFAFAHSNCGVDLATRNVIEAHGLKGYATTPTRYTQYVKGIEHPATREFPNGYIEAQFPFPTVLSRGLSEVNDYAITYSKLVGENNPITIFGGGEHAFYKDAKTALFEREGSVVVPYDIVKEELGYTIPALDENNKVINASRYYLERVNENPFKKYKTIFDSMPDSPLKQDLRQNDAQMAVTAIMFNQLKAAGKIAA